VTLTSAYESLRRKYLTPCNYKYWDERFGTDEVAAYQNFCAGKLQSKWKSKIARKKLNWQLYAMYHVAAIQIQWFWRGLKYRSGEEAKSQVLKKVDSVKKIQKAWRC